MEEKAEQAKQQKQQNNVLLLACTRGYTADAQQLVQTGAQITARDKRGCTTLHFAAAHGQLDVVTYLWSKGAELDWETPDGRTPLHVAALKGHSNVVSYLLGKQSWADAQDAQDNTALHLAARGKNEQVLRHLLEVQAATNYKNKLGLTPPAEAIVSGRTQAAELLLDKDPQSMLHKPRGWSLLHLAAALGQAPSVTLLLKHKANIHDQQNSNGLSPLHAAAISGSVKCIKLLLEAGASTSALSHDGSLASDLVPTDHTDRSQLRALLKSSASSAQKQKQADSNRTASDASDLDPDIPPEVAAFKALWRDDRIKRCQRWAESGPDKPSVRRELRAFWPEVTKTLAEAHGTVQAISLHKVLMMLRNDEDYQKDVGDPKAMDALIQELQQHPDRFERYTQDPAIKSAFKKIELFQSMVKMTGNRGKVPWQETLTLSRGPNWKAEDEARKRGLHAVLHTQLEAAVAAALAGSQEESVTAASAAAEEAKQRLITSQNRAATGTTSASPQATAAASSTPPQQTATTAAAGSSTPHQAAATAGTGGGKPPRPPKSAQGSGQGGAGQQKGSSGRDGSAGAVGQGGSDGDDDPYRPLTWREALWRMRFQIIGNVILLLLFFLYTLWIRYSADQRAAEDHMPGMQNSAQDKTEL